MIYERTALLALSPDHAQTGASFAIEQEDTTSSAMGNCWIFPETGSALNR